MAGTKLTTTRHLDDNEHSKLILVLFTTTSFDKS